MAKVTSRKTREDMIFDVIVGIITYGVTAIL